MRNVEEGGDEKDWGGFSGSLLLLRGQFLVRQVGEKGCFDGLRSQR